MSQALRAVREAAVDGRLHNIIYRQTQLEKLQKALLDSADYIESAIKSDSGHNHAEVTVEYILTLENLKDYYDGLDAEDALYKEYAIARGEDAPHRIVYVIPSLHITFYSIVVAVNAAIAAGNCVVIESIDRLLLQLESTMQDVPTLLLKLLKTALDPSIVEFVSSRSSDADLGPNHIRLFQSDVSAAELQFSSATLFSPLISPSQPLVIAIVDRIAGLPKAAQALVTARLSFGGNSLYSPDVILVNEYVRTPFHVAVVEEVIQFTANSQEARVIDSEQAAKTKSLIQTGLQMEGVEAITSTGRGSVYEVTKRCLHFF
ncbi:hypothetical protein ACMFMF_010937 [Clarireedia jacksonii]